MIWVLCCRLSGDLSIDFFFTFRDCSLSIPSPVEVRGASITLGSEFLRETTKLLIFFCDSFNSCKRSLCCERKDSVEDMISKLTFVLQLKIK